MSASGDTAHIVNGFIEYQGWTGDTVLDLLMEYIDNQQSPEALRDFLSERCAPTDDEE